MSWNPIQTKLIKPQKSSNDNGNVIPAKQEEASPDAEQLLLNAVTEIRQKSGGIKEHCLLTVNQDGSISYFFSFGLAAGDACIMLHRALKIIIDGGEESY